MILQSPWLALAVGILCGIVSGFGVGGGSVLMVWLTAVAAMDQRMAQGINLLYFLPTSLGALIFHIRNKMVCWKAVIPAALCGCVTAALAAWLAAALDVSILRKLFGGFLLVVGLTELFRKTNRGQNSVT